MVLAVHQGVPNIVDVIRGRCIYDYASEYESERAS